MLSDTSVTIEDLWREKGFNPTENQIKAILHTDGPLFITAGPGAGKTSVLLWRTVNLIVFNNIKPSEILLCTFTEKAALQLKEGLLSLLGLVTQQTGQPYDISEMSIGTIHSICQKILKNKNVPPGIRPKGLSVKDELAQFIMINRTTFQKKMFEFAGIEDVEEAKKIIIKYFENKEKERISRFNITDNLVKLFNRLSEEDYDCEHQITTEDDNEIKVLKMYQYYINSLMSDKNMLIVDLSLLQQAAYRLVKNNKKVFEKFYKHIIVDEYQDTNPIQEKLLFVLAEPTQNICVVGDDDQSLYRFRGATVENFVEFSSRCYLNLSCEPTKVNLNTNFRSRKEIVDFYKHFINHELIDWTKESGVGYYRVKDKDILPNNSDNGVAVVKSKEGSREGVATEIASLIKSLKTKKIITDYNQAAFLFPSLKTKPVEAFQFALEKLGIPVFAPRAGKFLEVMEAQEIFGFILDLFNAFQQDSEEKASTDGDNFRTFDNWLHDSHTAIKELLTDYPYLKEFFKDKELEIDTIKSDYKIIIKKIDDLSWHLEESCSIQMLMTLSNIPGLSIQAKKHLSNNFFADFVKRKFYSDEPITLSYVINRATSLDWSLLDLFYQICSFKPFKTAFDSAEEGTDEGPICNLSLISQYIAKFTDTYSTIISASNIQKGVFISSLRLFLRTIYHLSETEYEDKENPFPKGRIPFLTIHQAKGLEFPVVVLGSMARRRQKKQPFEEIIRRITNKEGEPLERISEFDDMRLFYVALSRPQNLLIFPHFEGNRSGIVEPFKTILKEKFITPIDQLDLDQIPLAKESKEENEKIYSFSSDYLLYKNCPRNYMIFRKYGFIPSRTQTMFFGNLVHRTIDDIHRFLINKKLP